ncbi:hypothetical protein [Kitasatospora sp. NBC_01302]|uniref:hypothetical protein n=1 Tax=Kitasatospora sp. NBC_01302 TaxID=2903575 RepID=UPI002E0F9370|nr:hypothetical protein OG294_14235 [Kitasatospora sp. NBC_01302]
MSGTPWPEGVTGRYLTVAGAALADPSIAVDVISLKTGGYDAQCNGCTRIWGGAYTLHVHQWAQEHAEKCRAIPRPEAQE